MQHGTVKYFNETKGFGFITPNDGGQDVFVHNTGLRDDIRQNDNVTFNFERIRPMNYSSVDFLKFCG